MATTNLNIRIRKHHQLTFAWYNPSQPRNIILNKQLINPYDIDVHLEMIFENSDKEDFVLDTKDIKEVLDGVPLLDASITSWIKEYISEGLK